MGEPRTIVPVYTYDANHKVYVYARSVSNMDVNRDLHLGGLCKGSKVLEPLKESNIVCKVSFANSHDVDSFLDLLIHPVPPFWPCILENENMRDVTMISAMPKVSTVYDEMQRIRQKRAARRAPDFPSPNRQNLRTLLNQTTPGRQVSNTSNTSAPPYSDVITSNPIQQQYNHYSSSNWRYRKNRRLLMVLFISLATFVITPYYMFYSYLTEHSTSPTEYSYANSTKHALELYEKEELVDSVLWFSSILSSSGTRYFIADTDTIYNEASIAHISPPHPSLFSVQKVPIFSSFVSGIPDVRVTAEKIPGVSDENNLLRISISIPRIINKAAIPQIVDTSHPKYVETLSSIQKLEGFLKIGSADKINFRWEWKNGVSLGSSDALSIDVHSVHKDSPLSSLYDDKDDKIYSKRIIIQKVVDPAKVTEISENYSNNLKWFKLFESDSKALPDLGKADSDYSCFRLDESIILSSSMDDINNQCRVQCLNHNKQLQEDYWNKSPAKRKLLCNSFSALPVKGVTASSNCHLFSCPSSSLKNLLTSFDSTVGTQERNSQGKKGAIWLLSKYQRSLSIYVHFDKINERRFEEWTPYIISLDTLVYLLGGRSVYDIAQKRL